jgi:tRNA A-37 threonylcarbamoyl transferase component Bud32
MNEPGETVARPAVGETVSRVDPDSAASLVRILDQYLADVQAGRAPDHAQILAQHPALAAQLEPCLAGIEFIARAAGPAGPARAENPARLGDFQIVREVGRGGMGVVYEAEQLSLKRRVALKVLRFGVVADEDAMLRFQREAETVARLHHTNIVPIFAVGSEEGVSYFAMQFVEGRSLADVAAEGKIAGRPAAPEQVARWALQAAEALGHAHCRGVIHRDVKPSNLLLDAEGLVWLTDFGLAKRADEVTLTLSGVIMGTPRYMSPEQARAAREPVDHRSDLYSLGATLYELATGQPVFDAESARDVITQILNGEPVAPRRHCRTLPRDLETIILKCLQKDPARRYATADDLAGDLRSFVLGHSIRARRPNLAERLVRLARRHRMSAALVAVAMAVSIAATLGGLVAGRWYNERRLGHVVVNSDMPLTVEILDPDRDTPATDPFTAPTRMPVPLREGVYEARVSAPGKLGQTYRLLIDRGKELSYSFTLDDPNLWDAPAKDQVDLVRAMASGAEGRPDLVVLGQGTLRRLDGKTGRRVWENEKLGDALPQGWQPLNQPLDRTPFGQDAALAEPAPDLDGDGAPDLVWAARRSASLVACSGKTGAVLWSHHARAQGNPKYAPVTGRVVGDPVTIDADGDGTPDLVTAFGTNQPPASRFGFDAGPGPIWIDAVSGRSGRRLWRFDGGESTYPPAVVVLEGRSCVGVVTGSRWLALDPKTGREVVPALQMKSAPAAPPVYADLDRDGRPELLTVGGTGPSGTVSAHVLATGRLLWSQPVTLGRGADFRIDRHRHGGTADSPLVVDLDGDGQCEVIAPGGAPPRLPMYAPAGVQVLDGATGRVRWRHLAKATGRGHGFREAPDLDGDGVRDIVEASVFQQFFGPNPNEWYLYIDALSGKDGRTLWWWNHAIERGRADTLASLTSWQSGRDGRPELIVGLREGVAGTTFILEGGSGRLVHTIASVAAPGVADLDADGRLDLWYVQGNRIQAIRGSDPEAWRWADHWEPAADYDHDGITDLIRHHSYYQLPTTAAISGRDGRLLWTAGINSGVDGFNPAYYQPRTLGEIGAGFDLDGDGTPDLIVEKVSMSTDGQTHRLDLPIAAISGKTGATLWTPDTIDMEHDGAANASLWGLDVEDLDGDKRPEVLVYHDLHHTNPGGGPIRWQQAWLTLLSGRDGSVRWHRRLDPDHDETRNRPSLAFPHALADLNGDGFRDAILAHVVSTQGDSWSYDLGAFDGKTGARLWHDALGAPMRKNDISAQPGDCAVFAEDLDGNGTAEIVVREQATGPGENSRFSIAVRDGATGARRWEWHRDVPGHSVTLGLARLGRGECRAIVLRLPDGRGKDEILVLDARGAARQRRGALGGLGLQAYDLDGDGADELVFLDGDALRVTRHGCVEDAWSRAGVARTRWEAYRELRPARTSTFAVSFVLQQPERDAMNIRVLDIRPARATSPATIVVNQRLGLDGTTGRVLWETAPNRSVLDFDDQRKAVLALERTGDATLARLIPSSADGLGRGEPPGLNVRTADPRRVIELPWAQAFRFSSIFALLLVAMIDGLLALGIVVFPGWLVLRTLRPPWRMSLASLLHWPLAAAISSGGFVLLIGLVRVLPVINGTPGAPLPLRDDVMAAAIVLAGLPVVALVARLGADAWHRRWRRLTALLGLWLAVSAALAGLLIWFDPRLDPLDLYTCESWPTIVAPGAYATGLVLVIWAVLKGIVVAAFRVGRPLWERVARHHRPVKADA